MYLEGKRIVITGASSGIGKSLAIGLSDLGAVTGLIARSVDTLKLISAQINEDGGSSYYHGADVSNYHEIETAISKLHDEMGGIDVLINNAGIGQYNPHDVSKEGIDRLVDINFKGVLYTSAVAVKYMKQADNPTIINSSSIEAKPEFGMGYIYSCTKAAVNAFASFQHPSGLYASNNITVNSIMIGLVDTPIFGPTPDPIVEKITQRYQQKTGLAPADPSDLVPYFGFFASDEGNAADHRVVDMIHVEQARNILESIDTDSADTEEIMTTLREQLNDRDAIVNLTDNFDLLQFLLDY